MTEGSIAKALFRFSVPILLGNIFQQLYNTADAFIVGNLVGDTALAAVSSVGSIIWLLIGVFNGFAQGSGVIIARYFGAKDDVMLKKAVHTHVILCIVGGILLAIFGVLLSPLIISLMNTPETVVHQSELYLKIFFAGGVGLTVYNGCTGLMQAVGDSRHPLYYLIFSSCLNVVLDIVFIKFFGMGVDGAALATIIAQFISAILCVARLFRVNEVYRLEISSFKADRSVLRQIFSYGVPAAIQNGITSFANTMIQANINSFGDMAMAGVGAMTKIEGFLTQPIVSLGMALSTFTSQNLGAKEYERAKKGAKYGVLTDMGIAFVLGIIFRIFAAPLIGTFTHAPEAIAYGVRRVAVCGFFYFALAATHALAGVMRGAGKPMITMIAFVGCWCVLRVIILKTLVPICNSIDLVFAVFPITWMASTIFLAGYTIFGKWASPKEDVPSK